MRALIFLPPKDIVDLIAQMEKEQEAIKKQIIDICYFMRGGINWEDAWNLSFLDRESIVKVLSKRLKEEAGDKTEQL